MEPARQIRDAQGRVVDATPGRDIKFENHVYQTDDPAEIAFLRSMRGYGTEVMEVPESFESPITGPEIGSVVSTSTAVGRPRGRPRALKPATVPQPESPIAE